MLNDYTVTIAGSERHDGENPSTYVVQAESMMDAKIRAMVWHLQDSGDKDLVHVSELSFAGVPEPNSGYTWNDLREQTDYGLRDGTGIHFGQNQ